jgi:hypothetical protein
MYRHSIRESKGLQSSLKATLLALGGLGNAIIIFAVAKGTNLADMAGCRKISIPNCQARENGANDAEVRSDRDIPEFHQRQSGQPGARQDVNR